jgi:hypothetical protein
VAVFASEALAAELTSAASEEIVDAHIIRLNSIERHVSKKSFQVSGVHRKKIRIVVAKHLSLIYRRIGRFTCHKINLAQVAEPVSRVSGSLRFRPIGIKIYMMPLMRMVEHPLFFAVRPRLQVAGIVI